MKYRNSLVFAAGAVAGIGLLFILGTGPGLVTFPNSQNYRVTFAPDGSFASTTGICDINNPVNCMALGQQLMANSLPAVIASNQSPIPTNDNQVNGVTTSVNAGNADTGTRRVVVATNQSPIATNPAPTTTGGWTPSLQNALSTTVKTVKGSAGELGAYYCWNPNATVEYVQIFDTAGAVTLGTTVPVKSLGIPPTGAANLEFSMGVHFANAIKVAATTTATGLTAPATALDCNFDFN